MVDQWSFVLADIPGLIEGASEGAGLGTRFLGHVERCRVLLHLVDGTQEDVAAAYRQVRHEMKAYGSGLADKTEIVALNKCDALTDDEIKEQRKKLARAARCKMADVMLVSGVSGKGVPEVLRALVAEIGGAQDAEKAAEAGPAEEEAWRP